MLNEDHNPPEGDVATRQKTRLGVRFFFIYFFFYAGFVLIGVFNYDLLSVELIKGINLAIVYGIGLIFFAILLGILYNYFCSKYEDADTAGVLKKEVLP